MSSPEERPLFLYVEDNDEHRLRAQIVFHDLLRLTWNDHAGEPLYVPDEFETTLENVKRALSDESLNAAGLFLDLGLSIVQFNILAALISASEVELIEAVPKEGFGRRRLLSHMARRLEQVVTRWGFDSEAREVTDLWDTLHQGRLPVGGLRILEVLRGEERFRYLPIFIFSDFQPGRAGEKFFEYLGADGFIYKPSVMSRRKLRAVYRALLRIDDRPE